MSDKKEISEEDFLVFPDHPKFQYVPKQLISFNDWVCTGLYVPVPESQDTSSAAADNQEDAEHEIFKDREVDAFDIETVTLGLDHVQLGSDSVPYISSGDAWNIATDPSWSEPSGTRRGNWGADAIPFRRTLNAFNQYLKSRSLALTKAHQVFVHAFREHTDLVSTRDGLHMNSGWNPPAGRTTIHKENESCWFLRDMRGCLNVWWKSMLERPGQGWSKVPALDSIRIIRGFLNYLQNFDIYPEATEPFLHNSLEQACKAAESAYDQMFSATAVYASTWDQHNGWSGLGRKIWCPEVEDEEDIDKQTPVRMDWNQIPTLQMEENEASKENGNLAGQADEARAEDEEEKQKTVKVMEGWHETADKGEKLLIDAAPAEAARMLLEDRIGQKVDPSGFTVKRKFKHTRLRIAGVTRPSPESKVLSDLARRAVATSPDGYYLLELVADQEVNDAVHAHVLLDVNASLDLEKFIKGISSLRLIATLVEVRPNPTNEDQTINHGSTWFLAKVSGFESEIPGERKEISTVEARRDWYSYH